MRTTALALTLALTAGAALLACDSRHCPTEPPTCPARLDASGGLWREGILGIAALAPEDVCYRDISVCRSEPPLYCTVYTVEGESWRDTDGSLVPTINAADWPDGSWVEPF